MRADGGEDDQEQGDDGGGVEDLVVEEGVGECGGVGEAGGGVVEEEVVLDAEAGGEGHGDLDVAAFVGGGDEVEGGQAQAEEGAGGGVEG